MLFRLLLLGMFIGCYKGVILLGFNVAFLVFLILISYLKKFCFCLFGWSLCKVIFVIL